MLYLIGVVNNVYQIALLDMQNHLLKTDAPRALEQFVLIQIPFVLGHGGRMSQCVHHGNAIISFLSNDMHELRRFSGVVLHAIVSRIIYTHLCGRLS